MRIRLTFVVALLAASSAAFAQSTVTVTGAFGIVVSVNDNLTIGFTCTGAPTCVGTFQLVEKAPQCSNAVAESGAFTMTGLNLSQSGPISGTMTLAGADNSYVVGAGGICTIAPGASDAVIPYTGTWNLPTLAGSITVQTDRTLTGGITATGVSGSAAPPPVFQMTVTSNINAQTATATAAIQFRPQDVGQSGSVFTFASAPAPLVQGGLESKAVHLGDSNKVDTPCVLAQLNSQGQLVAVSAAQLQALVTGAFSAQGTSVSILNGVPTPRVAGATFYVGYGANANAMLNDGIFRNAVLIPGNSTCPPLPYMTSLWWNPAESGWGLNLNQQGSTMFGTLFTYDAGRAPLWLVMPAGAMQPDGVTFTGDLYRTTGPAFNANPFTPIGGANITRVGNMSISFSHANAATLTYSVNGANVTKTIQRQVYGSRASNCMPTTEGRGGFANYQDLWWNANESGWGLNVTHQDNTFFATLFTYDPSGRDLWLVLPAGTRQADGSYFGDLYRTTGSPFNTQPFPPLGTGDVTAVGNMRLRFTSGNTGTLTYVYNGTTVTKSIVRQEFSTPVFACN